jgi:hypothetical protein
VNKIIMISQDVVQQSVSESVVKIIPGIDAVVIHGQVLLTKNFVAGMTPGSSGEYPTFWHTAAGKQVCPPFPHFPLLPLLPPPSHLSRLCLRSLRSRPTASRLPALRLSCLSRSPGSPASHPPVFPAIPPPLPFPSPTTLFHLSPSPRLPLEARQTL